MPGLVVDGWVTNNAPAEPSLQRLRFHLRTDGKRWLVRFSGPLGPAHHREVFFDGDKTCYLNNLKLFVEERRERGESTGNNVATAMIRAGPIPFFPLVEEAGMVWLTYLSGEYFARNNSREGFITPPCQTGILGFGHVRFEDLVLQKYRRSTDSSNSLGVPDAIDYFFAATNQSDTALREIERRLGVQTNAVFRVVKSAQLGAAVIPEQSTLVVRIPAEFGPAVSEVTFFLQATNMALTATGTNFVAEIPGPTHFTDARLVIDHKPLLCSYAGERWLSDGEVKQLPEYKRARVWQPGHVSPGGTVLVLAIMAILALLPLFLVRVNKRVRQTNQPPKKKAPV